MLSQRQVGGGHHGELELARRGGDGVDEPVGVEGPQVRSWDRLIGQFDWTG
jgi:hypothetical protein